MEIPRGLTLLLLMIHLTREEGEMEEEEMEGEEGEEEESAAKAQLPPGQCYALSKKICNLFLFNEQQTFLYFPEPVAKI